MKRYFEMECSLDELKDIMKLFRDEFFITIDLGGGYE